jgi:phosphatidylglycerophosphate synthase
MSVSTDDACATRGGREPRRAGRELLLEWAFRPAASLLVPFLRPTRVSPPAVVLANAATGLVAAVALARGELLAAAVLLQAKTLLDNLDGELARATGRVTLLGRYLDTLADLVVNAALFVALGHLTGQWPLATAAFVALTLVLAADFNATELHRAANPVASVEPLATGRRLERGLAAVYGALLGPLDRAARSLADRRLPSGTSYDAVTVTVLANMGLTTQLVALGVCLALGLPSAYLWLCLGCLAALVPLQIRAERRARTV